MREAIACLFTVAPVLLYAQQPVSRAEAVAAALARGARMAVSRADTTAALGGVRAARAFPNPTFSGSYTKDPPNYHALADLPLDMPWLRSPRIGAAEAARDAARYQFAFERAAIRFDVDTTYTRSLAAALQARLSRRTADDADSLLKIAELRRDVGDVSELDVRLAAVNAGQLANTALDDSLAALTVLLSLQLQMGLTGDAPAITLRDSLAPPPPP
ncbi:MAG TPA: TolC family protein, partial [Gemmatimonadales bacterium]|nr:TolC family protein [Gemmatimonadales bacterium]